MVRRHVPALLAAAAAMALLAGRVTLAWSAPAPPIVGGKRARLCDWPSVVLLEHDGLLCTGTLVSSRIVLYAAHCGIDFTQVTLGEALGVGRYAPIKRCEQYSPGERVNPTDFAYCELARPINGVPVAPVLYGCEADELTAGRDVTIVGFGEDDDSLSGQKRYADTIYQGVEDRGVEAGMLMVGGEGIGASFGDSGGPAFVQLDDGSWRAIGIVSGGPEPGMPVYYVDMRTTVEWVERTSGYDITPCHAVDGTWEPGFECGGFASQPLAGGTWDAQCSEEDPLSGRSATCGEPHEADPDRPEVVIASPEADTIIDDPPAEVTIEIEASDATSDIRRVWLQVDGELRDEDVTAPFGFTASLGKGTYTLVALAEDSGGNTGASEEQELYVGEEPGGGCLGCRAGAGRGGRGEVGDLLLAALAGALWLATCRAGSRPRS
ncbi:MAG TPA: trypsin-like serine protease [Kofleriaceae bacterium]|nr:trypsin-like serine protease [Kofleriaceae bacterium]